MAAVAITRTEMTAGDLRAAAKRSADAKQASRILAIAMVLDGFSREDAARLCGMDRQTYPGALPHDVLLERSAIGFTATTKQVWMGLPAGREAAARLV